MNLTDFSDVILNESDGVFTLKNNNTTLGFVRFNNTGEVEYIFVNPIFRKKNLAKKLLNLVREKTQKKLIFQKPISPLGLKLLKSIEKWN
ncbi:GNAT family N-acetyltransferase [Candidatus Pelagibacter sp.]|nr:GNAT family N-acetyltransferase [Candidatus Pelagibacter sp.]